MSNENINLKKGIFTADRLDDLEIKLIEVIESFPGIKLSLAVTKIRHHYRDNRSAKSALRQMIILGKIEGIKYSKGGVLSLDDSE